VTDVAGPLTTRVESSAPEPPEGSEVLADRLLAAGVGALELVSVHVGDQLGWYRALLVSGPMTSAELAAATGTAERYAREWLELQAVSGLLDVVVSSQDWSSRRFALPPATRDVVSDPTSELFTAPLARLLVTAIGQLPELLRAYRTGRGVPWSAHGEQMRTAQAEMNRPWLENRLPAVLRRDGQVSALLQVPGARAADIGCGAAWSSVAIARTFPGVQVDAVDIDSPTVELARATVTSAGLSDRVHVRCADAGDLDESSYDVVFAFECIHDLPHPVEVLAAARRALRPGGVVVVMDEAVAESFTAPGDQAERLMYGFSLLICLPDGMSAPGSAATGTVMRSAQLDDYARRAGFSALEVMPVSDFGFWRFYRVVP